MSDLQGINKGTCPVDRRIFEQDWFCQLSYSSKVLAFFLLIKANYTDKASPRLKTVIKRGQWAGSVGNHKTQGTLINETGLPYSTLKDALNQLEEVGFIKKQARQGCFTVLEIVDYDALTGADNGTKTDTSTTKPAAKSGAKSTTNNKKEEKKSQSDKEDEPFDWDD